MADIRVTLTTRLGDSIIADPIPEGLENMTIVIERDAEAHGVFFDYGIDALSFTGDAAQAIDEEYEEHGANGLMLVLIEYMCGDTGGFEEVYTGKLDYGTYKRLCGIECATVIELEPSDDIMKFRNNYDQKVDLLSNIALDGGTVLDEYDGLNFDLSVPARELRERLEGSVLAGNFPLFPISYTTTGLFTTMSVRPSYTENQISELEEGDLAGASNYRVNPQNVPAIHPFVLSPVLNYTLSPGCTSGVLNYNIRLKGHVAETGSANRRVHLQLVFHKGTYDDTPDPAIQKVSIFPSTIILGTDGPDIDFDETFTGTVPVEIGDQFRIILFSSVLFNAAGRTTNLYVTWDAETSMQLYANTLCPATPTKAFAINEALSRVSESITNGRLRVLSDLFGRTDSQPYSRPVDNCAALFAITSGLNIRRKLLPNGLQPGFFKSMRELIEDLNSMWNIGYTIEPDTERPGYSRLRIENWEHFYQNQIGLVFTQAVQIEKNIDLSRIYNQLLIGFEKWEAQRSTGLDEFMTQRTYRVDVNTFNNVLDRMCQMILSSYCIEETRRLSDTTQDWTYDNDTFGFVLKRGVGTLNMRVEMMAEVAVEIENILNPGTCYNVRVSPARNAMRWFNFIMQGLKVLDANKKLWFSEGKGNYVAAYRLISCFIEGSKLQESFNIDINRFANGADAQPITFAETDTFDHPLSITTFRRLRNETDLMFKSIQYYCNNSPLEGWIKRITFALRSGMAQVVVIPKNTLQIPVPIPPCDAFVSDLEMVSCGDGCYSLEWIDGIGDTWQWTLQNVDNPGESQSGTSNVPGVQFTDLNGTSFNFTVQGFCGEQPGQNIAEISFAVEPIPPMIQLSAFKFFSESLQEWKWKVLVEPVNTPTFVVQCEFFFKRCSFFDGGTQCNSPALGEWGTIQCNIGASSTTGDTWGGETEDSVLEEIKIRLASLSGMAPDQIIKKPGETWDLIFE